MNLSIKRVVKNWKESSKIKFNKKDFIQNPISFGRRYSKQKPSKELWKKAFSEFNLIPEMYEPEIGNVLMNHYEDNACTHVHTDPAPKGYTHVRANVLLKKPKEGGDMIVDNQITNLEKNDLWLILASLENHGSTPIKNGERLVYSFGALVKDEQVNKILQDVQC